jgi:hypothetical protein
LGYQLFRVVVGAPILVALDPGPPVEPFELNLFAAKPDRIKSLRDEGFLAEQHSGWQPNKQAIRRGLSLLRQQVFAPSFGHALDHTKGIDADYAKGLAAFAAWRTEDLNASERCAALFSGYRTLAALCNRSPTTARYSTFARLAWEGGWRDESVIALRQMAAYIQHIPFQPTEPCWPANPRIDNIDVGKHPAHWFAAGVAEQLERTYSYSSYFSGASPWLGWLCEQPAASSEMHRRKVLLAARCGMAPNVPARLRKEAPDHLNAPLWSAGLVPGTSV